MADGTLETIRVELMAVREMCRTRGPSPREKYHATLLRWTRGELKLLASKCFRVLKPWSLRRWVLLSIFTVFVLALILFAQAIQQVRRAGEDLQCQSNIFSIG